MTRWTLMLALWGVMGGGCVINTGTAPSKAKEVHLFLLAGQSNMAGRGEVTPDRLQPLPDVMALREDGSWGAALDPLHWDKTVAGVGLARSFARAYQRSHPDVIVGFIPAACGGSHVEAWTPGFYYEPTRSHPYDDALARVAAVRDRGELKGMLWHQGESDSKPERVERYEERLQALFARLRRDLDAPNLPILVGQLGQFPEAPWTPERGRIDAVHRAVAEADPRIGFVPSVGLSSKADLVHFDATALDEFGERYARAWQLLESETEE